MQVEARLVRRSEALSSSGTSGSVGVQLGGGDGVDLKSKSAMIAVELKSWARLFSPKFIDRTWIGILMMVFQRASEWSSLPYLRVSDRAFCSAVVLAYLS